MTSRFGKRNRSSSKLNGDSSPTNGNGTAAKRIKELEVALQERDKTIAEQKDRIKELSSEVEHRKRLVEDLTVERNALRQKNSSLVGKLAELSRKQSVSSFTTLPSPPRLPKRPQLPPTPASPDAPFKRSPTTTSKFNFSTPGPAVADSSPSASLWQNGLNHSPPQNNHISTTTREEESETDYSDMEEDNSGRTTPLTTMAKSPAKRLVASDEDRAEFVNSGLVRESEVDRVLAAVSDTARRMKNNDSSPLSVHQKEKENGAVVKKPPVEKTPSRDGSTSEAKLQKRTSVEVLAAQFERATNSGTLSASTSPHSMKNHSPPSNHQGSPRSPSMMPDASPSEPWISRSHSIPTEVNVAITTDKHNRTPSTRSAGATPMQESKKIGTGSESIASRIASLISGNRRNSKDRGSPVVEQTNGGGVAAAEQNGKVQSQGSMPNEPTNGRVPGEFTPMRTMPKSKQDSIVSNIGSDVFSSGDYSTTDIDSSFDFTSPPISPANSLGASNLTRVIVSPVKSLERDEARKAALNRAREMKKKSARFNVDLDEEDEEEDTLGDLLDSRQKMRARTKTLSSSTGISTRTTLELGRGNKRSKKEMRERQLSLKRHRSLTDLSLIGKDFVKDLELISPDFESKIQDTIRRAFSEKYGGLEKATQAAIKIQHSWRQFKLRSRFQKIKQQNKSQLQIQLRKRAQSMRDPLRRPSIMKKRNKAYNREKSVANISPRLLAKSAAMNGGPLAIGLVKTNVAPCVKITEELIEREEEEMLESGGKSDVSDVTTCREPHVPEAEEDTKAPKVKLNDSSVVLAEPPLSSSSETASQSPKNTPDGLSGSRSFTSGESNSPPRPLSVFSTGSSLSVSGSYQEDLGRMGRTLPRMRPLNRYDSRDRALSTGSCSRLTCLQKRKKSIGVNHFNRKPTKGIQYLVESQVLVDDPRSVADFLTDSAKNKLSKQKIGEFVGEINSDFNMAVLGCLLEQMDMSSKPIDTALRELQQLFRMPGEAQKIDKIMEIFALEYFKHNKDNGDVRSEDAAYILSFAIMMLHTALHNPSVKHKTTRREWVSMNRGCNDGKNFPEPFLLDIYNRIQSTEFICGKDHTQEVADIEKQIIGSTTLPKLATPQRHLVMKINVTEIFDLSRGPNFRHRHRRTVFIFNDMVVICKQRRHEQYQCRSFFQLVHVLPVKFETEHYRNGIQLLSSIERKVLLQCTCDSLQERTDLLDKLEETIKELEEMEKERIEELGSSLTAKPGQDVLGGSVRHSSTKSLLHPSNAMASSSLTDLRNQPVSEEGELGDSMEASGSDSQQRPASSVSERNNRSSGDSGFDSPQQDTPTTTPTPSPTDQNIVEATDSLTPSPSPSPSPSLIPPSSPNALTPPHSSSSISHSRSHDGLRTLTVYPTLPDRSPSAELIRSSPSPSASPSHKRGNKKEKTPKEKKKSHYVNIFSIGRARGREMKGSSPGSSPKHSKKRRASDTPTLSHRVNVREVSDSPPQAHKKLAQSLQISSSIGQSGSDHEMQT